MKGKLGAAFIAATAVVASIGFAPVTNAATTVFISEDPTQPAGESHETFNGEFCSVNDCFSLLQDPPPPFNTDNEAALVQLAVQRTGPLQDIMLDGYSRGATTIYKALTQWADNPVLAPDPGRIKLILTYGNPKNSLGGRDPDAGLPDSPVLDPYLLLDVVARYDRVADKPDRWGLYSMINSSTAQHSAYNTIDVNDPSNLVWADGNSVHMLVNPDVLPMLAWRASFTSTDKMAELTAKYTPLIEKDYDRPEFTPQGEGADWANGIKPPSLSASSVNVMSSTVEDNKRVEDSTTTRSHQRLNRLHKHKVSKGEETKRDDPDNKVSPKNENQESSDTGAKGNPSEGEDRE